MFMNLFLTERLAEERIKDMLRDARQARQARRARTVKSPKKAQGWLSALLGVLLVL